MPGHSNADQSLNPEKRIVKTPGICGGQPRIAGHRIRVADVVLWRERLGMSDDEILSEYPSLDAEQVASALEYYRSNREEIRAILQREDDLADAFIRDGTPLMVRPARGRDGGVPTPPG